MSGDSSKQYRVDQSHDNRGGTRFYVVKCQDNNRVAGPFRFFQEADRAARERGQGRPVLDLHTVWLRSMRSLGGQRIQWRSFGEAGNFRPVEEGTMECGKEKESKSSKEPVKLTRTLDLTTQSEQELRERVADLEQLLVDLLNRDRTRRSRKSRSTCRKKGQDGLYLSGHVLEKFEKVLKGARYLDLFRKQKKPQEAPRRQLDVG